MTRDPEECAPGFPSHAWTEGLAGRVCPQCGATKPCCNASAQLSTERQAREAAEKEVARLRLALAKQNEEISQTLGKALGYAWFKDDPKNFPDATEAEGVCVGEHIAESLADEAAKRLLAAGKEVEGWKETYDRQSVLMGKYAREAIEAEAKLAALVKTAQAVSSATRQTLSGQWIITGDAEVLSCNLADSLSALPPPVPTEEGGGLKRCPFCAIPLKAETGSDPWWTHPVNGCVIGGKSIFPEDVTAWNTRPTQAPQDVAERPITMQDVRLAVGEGPLKPGDVLAGCNAELRRRANHHPTQAQHVEGLVEKIDCLETELFEAVQVAYRRGAVEWARLNFPQWMERLETNAAADGLRASPISHEDRPLELAAADNNRKALVELTKRREALRQAEIALSELSSAAANPNLPPALLKGEPR